MTAVNRETDADRRQARGASRAIEATLALTRARKSSRMNAEESRRMDYLRWRNDGAAAGTNSPFGDERTGPVSATVAGTGDSAGRWKRQAPAEADFLGHPSGYRCRAKTSRAAARALFGTDGAGRTLSRRAPASLALAPRNALRERGAGTFALRLLEPAGRDLRPVMLSRISAKQWLPAVRRHWGRRQSDSASVCRTRPPRRPLPPSQTPPRLPTRSSPPELALL